MNSIYKTAAVCMILALFASDALAYGGGIHRRTRRRTRRRTAVVVGTAAAVSSSSAVYAQQQAAYSQQQAAYAEQQAAYAEQQRAEAEAAAAAAAQAPQAPAAKLPLGTVVRTIPANAVAKAHKGVTYYTAGGNTYRAAFQGNALIYVTVAAP